MNDYFAIFDERRRPWLDAEALKEKFHALTAVHHPDVAPNAEVDFTALNTAYQTLRDPRTRLRHLLELECPDASAEARPVPVAVAALFMQTGELRQRLDVFLSKQTQAASPLTRALLESEKLSLLENVRDLLAILTERQRQLLDELRALDAGWEENKSAVAERLAPLGQSLSYLSKWTDQLREGIVKLSAG